MSKAVIPGNASRQSGSAARLLVLGYCGTLEPENTAPPSEPPPQLEALLAALLREALAKLDHHLPPDQRVYQGEPIPMDGLLATLRERLQEIMTLPLATYLASSNDDTGHDHQHLTRNYPALAPLLRQTVTDWASATTTFVRRLQRDTSRLTKWLHLDSLPPIESLTGTTSDLHPGGHLVLRIRFRNGPCVYYKPRPVTGEWLWHALLDSIKTADPTLSLPAARVLPGGAQARYGWMESLAPGSPASSPVYWHNAGAMLCLASHAGLTDLHLGNVIATPTGPAVTDAECLATPIPYDSSTSIEEASGHEFQNCLQSLLATGLLPGRATHQLPDVSGLFGSAANAPGLHLPQWIRDKNGEFLLKTVPASLCDHPNSSGASSPLTALPHLIDGYRRAAGALLRARHMLLAQESTWRHLLVHSHAPRIVLRNTLTYALLLSQSLDPGHLRTSQRRQSFLRSMLRQIEGPRLPAAALRAELRALMHLHFPRLVLLPCTRTLASASGTPLAHQFVESPPALEVMARLNNLSSESIETTQVPALINALLPRRKPV